MSGISSFATVAIAAAVGCVGFAQWWTARTKLRADLFDKRWAIYQAMMEMLSAIVTHARVTEDDKRGFLKGTRGTLFLFDKVADAYRKEVWRNAVKLEAAVFMLDSPPNEHERLAAVKAKYDVSIWASDQLDAINEKFRRFMAVEESFFSVIWRDYGPKP